MSIKIQDGKVFLTYEDMGSDAEYEVESIAKVASGDYFLFIKNPDGTPWGKLEVDAETYDAVDRALIEACGELLATL